MATKPHTLAIRKALAAAAEEGVNLDELVEVRLTGHAAWQTPPPAPGQPAGHENGYAGNTVELPRREAIRLEVLGYIAGSADEATPADTTVEEREDLAALAAARGAQELDAEAAARHAAAIAGGSSPTPPADASTPADPDASTDPAAPPADLATFLPGGNPANDPDVSALTNEELAELGAPELVAHVNQFSGDAERILELELERRPSSRRTTVLTAAGMTDEQAAAAKAGE